VCLLLRTAPARGARVRALKAILEILADERKSDATEISAALATDARLDERTTCRGSRTSTSSVQTKRYSFTDPLLRVWVRLPLRAQADRR